MHYSCLLDAISGLLLALDDVRILENKYFMRNKLYIACKMRYTSMPRIVGFFACSARGAALEWQTPDEMNTQEPDQKKQSPRALKAAAQVMLLVGLVPLGIAAGWQSLSPTPKTLVTRAAHGADAAALLELVERAGSQQAADAELRGLLRSDADAAHKLAALSAGNELALQYLISLARTQPEALVFLADLEIGYSFALEMLRQLSPAAIAPLKDYAVTCANARFLLGVAYENGYHVAQDWVAAAHWYRQAAELGYRTAEPYAELAAYEAGVVCYADARRQQMAARWFRMAAERGHAAAQCALGVCYAAGHGVAQDLQEAVRWYGKAAAQDYTDALYNLGWCYLHGEGVQADATAAASWFHRAALQGDDMAQYYLGRAYELGQGMPQDYPLAIHWYRQAAGNQQNDAAQCALGHCYAQGKGVEQNWQLAAHWYKLSAERGRTEAQLALAHCYEQGLGTGRDATTARYWRERATHHSQPTPP